MGRLGTLEIAQNDFLIALDFVLLILFARYVWYRVIVEGVDGWLNALSRPATKVGWALMLTYLSRWLDRLAFLFWSGGHYGAARPLGFAALVVAVWSAACVAKVFAGTAWGPRAWMWILGAGVCFAALAALAPGLLGAAAPLLAPN
jgi:hypothetical protein